MDTVIDQPAKKKSHKDPMSENGYDQHLREENSIVGSSDGLCENAEGAKKRKKNRHLKSENFSETENVESFVGEENNNNKDFTPGIGSGKGLEEENSVEGFTEVYAGGKKVTKEKNMRNKDTDSENFNENEESSARKDKKKKHVEEISEKIHQKRKTKGPSEEKPLKYSDSEKHQFEEDSIEESSSKINACGKNRGSIEEKLSKYNGRKKTRASEEFGSGEDTGEDEIVRKAKKKKKHGLGETGSEGKARNLMEEFEGSEGIGEEESAEKSKKKKKRHGSGETEGEEKVRNLIEEFEETLEKSEGPARHQDNSDEGQPMNDKSAKEKKSRDDSEETQVEPQNSEKSASIAEATVNGSPSKKKKKRDEGEEIEADIWDNNSNAGNLLEEGIENASAEAAESSESYEKAKNKENRKNKRKEREITFGDDSSHLPAVGDSDKSPIEGENPSTGDSPLHKKQKKVTFSDQVEVCETDKRKKEKKISVDSRNAAGVHDTSDEEDKLVWAKRFSAEEDQAIRDAISRYIKENGLDEDEGLHMILNCNKYPEVRKCWNEIGAALHWRPLKTVYIRAHVLYERSDERCWTADEIDALKRLQDEYGHKWNKIAKLLGKSRYHVKDKWRRVKRGVLNKGHMSQEEYQKLFDLVNHNLRLKRPEEEQKRTRRQQRDNINWEAIADKMETRDHTFLCEKWYHSLASSMVEIGDWGNKDDKILLRRLLESDASDEVAVDWDDLLEDRSGEICLKRWKQMVRHLGEYRSKPFLEKLDLLVKRYAPELMEEE